MKLQNPTFGALFENNKKNDKSPDFTGILGDKDDGIQISAWYEKSSNEKLQLKISKRSSSGFEELGIGSLERNENKKNESSPDIKGTLTYDGEEYDVGCWNKMSKNKSFYISLKVTPPYKKENSHLKPTNESPSESNSSSSLNNSVKTSKVEETTKLNRYDETGDDNFEDIFNMS